MSEAIALKTVGDWSKRIEIPLANALSASVEILGISGFEACQKAIVYMAKSAGKLTKVSPKLRKIVTNPAFKCKGGTARKRDMRRARFGVYKYKYKTGDKYFVPIYRGGEYGARIKYISRDKVLVKVGNRWEERNAGTDEFEVRGVMQHKLRNIGRRGLASRSWMWGLKGVLAEVRNVTDVKPITSAFFGGKTESGLVLTNRLRYIKKITPSDLEQTVAKKATDSIMDQVAKRVEKKLGVEVPRLAARRAAIAEKKLDKVFGDYFRKRGV